MALLRPLFLPTDTATAPLTLIWTVIVGVGVGGRHRVMASRPVSFLLPGYSRVVPRLSFALGGVCGGYVALCWTLGSQGPLPLRLGLLVGTWLLGTACCMVCTLVVFRWPQAGGALFAPILLLWYGPSVIVEAMTLAVRSHPFLGAAVALGAVFLSWRLLGWCELSRSLCGMPSLSGGGSGTRKLAQYKPWRKGARSGDEPEVGSPELLGRLVSGIRRNGPDSLGRHVCTAGYEWLATLTGRGVVNMALVAVGLVLASCYSDSQIMFAILPVILAAGAAERRQTHAFLPLGRRQLLHLQRVRVRVFVGAVICLGALLTVLTHMAAPVMPRWTLFGKSRAFRPVPLHLVLAQAALLPLWFAASVWLEKRRGAMGLLTLVAVVVLLSVLAVVVSGSSGTLVAFWLVASPVSWLVSSLSLRYHCLRRDML